MRGRTLFAIPVLLLSLASALQAAPGRAARPDGVVMAADEEQTVTVTIVRIDLTTRTVVLKDQTGKTYTFTLPAGSSIDLSKYKVGQTATATISTTVTTDKVTRARISKMQLMKLQ